jgi:hypothetical protein
MSEPPAQGQIDVRLWIVRVLLFAQERLLIKNYQLKQRAVFVRFVSLLCPMSFDSVTR